MWMKIEALAVIWCIATQVCCTQWLAGRGNYLEEAAGPTTAILDATYNSDCSIIYVVDAKLSADATYFVKEVDQKARAPRGMTYIELEVDGSKPNASMSDITPLLQETYWLRRRSWCVIVVMLSNDPEFLEVVGQVAKMERLLGYPTKMLVVTEINLVDLERLISYHWTYGMMNTMFVNKQTEEDAVRWSVYTFYKYSPSGSQIMQVATYGKELYVYKKHQLFPDKYKDFHGGTVNVSSLVHSPHLMYERKINENGEEETIIFGSDGMLLHAMEDKLNFVAYLMPSRTWEEALQFVIDRISYMSPVYWELVPQRLIRHDMSVVYEHAYFAFSMALTPAKPHWSGLFLPLTIDTWLGVLLSSVVAIMGLGLILFVKEKHKFHSKIDVVGQASYDIVAVLLDQNFNFLLPTSAPGRILILAWLIFTFIISSAYKANLKAFLMKPTEQSRAETVEELVEVVDQVQAESYLHSTKLFFMESDYLPFKKLGDFMNVGFETSAGMQVAVDNKRSAHVDFMKHMQYVMVEKFTKPDGTTALYTGKTKIAHFPSCWPLPHDLPFRHHLDDIIMHAVESGLMDKWYNDQIEVARRQSLKQQREYREKQLRNNEVVEEESSDGEGAVNLTIAHLQGPFIIFAVGNAVSILVFLYEMRYRIFHCC